ncbi:MAG: dihydrofolate reductase [Clostridiales bacterium]|nr:dihydrofolate reductase [Clostridiales bacterium]
MIILLASKGKHNEIGKENELIWNLEYSNKKYEEKTEGNVVVMGRNTFNALPDILPNRKHIVLSKTKKFNKPIGTEILAVDNVLTLIKKCRELSEKKDVYIIGGESMYNLFIDYADKMYITEIQAEDINADAFFPQIDENEWETKVLDEKKEKNIKFDYIEYTRK